MILPLHGDLPFTQAGASSNLPTMLNADVREHPDREERPVAAVRSGGGTVADAWPAATGGHIDEVGADAVVAAVRAGCSASVHVRAILRHG
jgi:hypothetical protein